MVLERDYGVKEWEQDCGRPKVCLTCYLQLCTVAGAVKEDKTGTNL